MFFKRLLNSSDSSAAAASSTGTDGSQQQPQQQAQQQSPIVIGAGHPHPPQAMATPSLPAGVQLMSADLQKKLSSRSIQYNMKVVIRGDRNVGKTSLFKRIQGLEFVEEYKPTEEIQVAHITWSYKTSDDVVKVEVWDVVDKGKPRQKMEGLKLSNAEKQIYSAASLDAEFIDVYKGAHCVIFVLDITKNWTMEYVEREMERVPASLPVLIVANRADQSHHRALPADRPRQFAEAASASRSGGVVACETSMRNNFGLRFIHSFLGVPFLVMQRNTLTALLEKNASELETMHYELAAMLDDPSLSYEAFSDAMTNHRRQQADRLSPAVAAAAANPPPPPTQSPQVQPKAPTALSNTTTASPTSVTDTITSSLTTIKSNILGESSKPQDPSNQGVVMTGVGRGQPIVVPPAAKSLHVAASSGQDTCNKSPTASSQTSRVFPPSSSMSASSSSPSNTAAPQARPSNSAISSVDDFVPVTVDDGNVDSFLAEEAAVPKKSPAKKPGGFMSFFSGSKQQQQQQQPPPQRQPPAPPQPQTAPPVATKKPAVLFEDSDNEDFGRPQIAGFSEDIDLDDMQAPAVDDKTTHSISEDDDDFGSSSVPPLPVQQNEDFNDPRDSRSSSILQPPSPPPVAFSSSSHSSLTVVEPRPASSSASSASSSSLPAAVVVSNDEGQSAVVAAVVEEPVDNMVGVVAAKMEDSNIWEEEGVGDVGDDGDDGVVATVAVDEDIDVDEPREHEQDQPAAVTFSDVDFSFLESVSTKKQPEVVAVVEKEEAKPATKKKAPKKGKKTKQTNEANVVATEKSGKKAGSKARSKPPADAVDEAPPVRKSSSSSGTSKATGKRSSGGSLAGRKELQQNNSRRDSKSAADSHVIACDEDDLESFLNS